MQGISDTLAQKIIDYRGQHGGFKSIDELENVEGFSEVRAEQLREAVTVSGQGS